MPSTLRLSLEVLRRRPFFTFVSLFGIAFTLTTLLVVSALLDGMLASRGPEVHLSRSMFLDTVRLAGENNEFVGGPGYALLDTYLRDLPGVEMTSFYTRRSPAVSFVDGRRVETEIRRTDAEYWRVFRFDFLEGSPFTAADVEAIRPIVVIDESTSREFFGEASALGRSIELGERTYDVVGVVRDVGPLRDEAAANAWAPMTTHLHPEWRELRRGDFAACFVAASPRDLAQVGAAIDTRIEAWQPLPDDRFDTLQALPQTRLERLAAGAIGVSPVEDAPVGRFYLMVALITFVFMLLPAVNLVNVNTSRILERASEIGVRKAFGASNAVLLRQFLVENVVLCILGGVLSLALAAVICTVVTNASWLGGAKLQLSPTVFLVGLGLAVFFGVISGILPAWRMAQLHPVQALRGGER